MRRFAALALALVLAVPAVAAESMTADMTFAGDFTSMTISTSITMDGQTSADMREGFDVNGNNDGQATQQEADQFMSEFSAMIEEAAAQDMDPADMRLDGNPGTSVTITQLAAKNAAGPISSTSPIRLEMAMKATLKPGAGPKHTLVMAGESSSDSSNMTAIMRVQAPTGYIIESHNAGAAGSLSSDKRTLTVDSAKADESGDDAEVTFAPAASSKSSPGIPAVILVAAVLAVAAVVARGRRTV